MKKESIIMNCLHYDKKQNSCSMICKKLHKRTCCKNCKDDDCIMRCNWESNK